jgi:lipopolysaccharide transport system ATP-binding protein
MSDIVIKAEHISKEYRLGVINHGTLYRDLQSWWARMKGRPDPNAPVETHWKKSAGKHGDRFKALQDISFDLGRGEVLGLIGGNGAGKSTLLKVLSRITAPTTGTIGLKGRMASLLEVGTGFHPELTGRENIYLNGALLGMSRSEVSKRFDEIVAFAEVDDFVDTPVKRYSSGMYVRLAFAVAAHLESEILLVDEVLAVGDVAFQKKCMGKMENIGSSGRTIIFVSHNMAAIESLCSKVLVLNHGKVEFQGKTAEGISHYYSGLNNKLGSNLQDVARAGDGRAKILDVWITDPKEEPLSIVRTGSTAVFNLRVRCNERDVRNLALAVGVTTLLGEGVAHFSTDVVGFIPDMESGQAILKCVVPKWNLRAGLYKLNIFLTLGGVLADWIQDGFRFQCEEGDYYGTGKLPPDGYSHQLVDFSWSSVAETPQEILLVEKSSN